MKAHPICSCRRFSNLWKANTKYIQEAKAWPLFLAILILRTTPSFSQIVYHRPDLSQKLSAFICEFSQSDDLPKLLWQSEIYDTLLSGEVVESKAKTKITRAELQTAALKFARKNKHAGASYGYCGQNRAWIASVPSPAPIVKATKQELKIYPVGIEKSCRKLSIDFARKDGGSGRTLWESYLTSKDNPKPIINLHFLGEGNISISCLPRNSTQGPELFALIPIHGMERPTPYAEILKGDMDSLISWINKVRILHGLQGVDSNSKPLSLASKRLLSHDGVKHDRIQLRQEKRLLEEKSIKFLGENRVIGRSPKEMAWLLWNSPNHRSLLLNDNATHLGLAIRKSQQNSLAIILMAKSNKL